MSALSSNFRMAKSVVLMNIGVTMAKRQNGVTHCIYLKLSSERGRYLTSQNQHMNMVIPTDKAILTKKQGKRKDWLRALIEGRPTLSFSIQGSEWRRFTLVHRAPHT